MLVLLNQVHVPGTVYGTTSVVLLDQVQGTVDGVHLLYILILVRDS